MPIYNVLSIEDDEAQRLLIAGMLAKPDMEGIRFSLQQASTLAEGVQFLATADVVLLDLELPDATGLDSLKRLAAVDHPPLIVLTSHGEPEVHTGALNSGAVDYLVKGQFDNRQLLRWLVSSAELWRKRRLDAAFKSLHELVQEVTALLASYSRDRDADTGQQL